MISQPEGLVEVLLDRTAMIHERDDAAMDLWKYDDQFVIDALLEIGKDTSEDPTILDSCGDSLASIWIRNKNFNREQFYLLSKPAKNALIRLFKANKINILVDEAKKK